MSWYTTDGCSPDAFKEWFWQVKPSPVALDIETVEDIIIGIGVGNEEVAAYVTKQHVREILPLILEANNLAPIVMHAGKSDSIGVRKAFPEMPLLRVWDTMVAANVLQYQDLDLQTLVRVVLGYHIGSFKDLTKEYKVKDLEGIPEEVVAEYNLSQIIGTWRLYREFEPRIRASEKLTRVLELEHQVLPILAQMEENGILIDAQRLAMLRERYVIEGDTYQEIVSTLTHGGITNVNSPKQVSEYLFEVLQHPAIYRSKKTGAPSTSERVLQKIAAGKKGELPEYKWIRPLLHTRQTKKLIGTYCDGILERLDEQGRSHTSLSQTTADTGRLASKEPNHQNIPKRRGPEIRRCFIAPEGCVLVAADMDQLELRLIAEESGEEKMQDAFYTGKDIHLQTALDIFGDPAKRFPAKVLNYTIVYLAGPQQIADQMGVSKAKAEMWQSNYFRKYWRLTRWIKDWGKDAEARGYVETWLGRRRDLRDFFALNQQEGVRKAVNTRIQGTAAEIMKLNMVKVETRLRELKLKSRQLIQIHDELLLEVPLRELEMVKVILEDEMSTHYHNMPLPTTIKVGPNWGDVK